MIPPRLRRSSILHVNLNTQTTMWANKPADLTLTLQKATEGFTEIVDRPTDNYLIDISQLLVPIPMKTKYNELTLTHNLSGVILPSERYQ